jgi:RimJ/RimL family protein N-acetyltransferase
VNFFCRDSEQAAAPATLPHGLEFRCWLPLVHGYPPRGSRSIANIFWWALAKIGGFTAPTFAEIRMEQGDRVLHRLIVTPRWYRFAFMAEHDLQIGAVWTSPEARRRRLARAAIAEAHRRFGTDGTRFWYITEAGNAASEALARSSGYELVATGRRTRRFGSRLLGQYVIDAYLSAEVRKPRRLHRSAA